MIQDSMKEKHAKYRRINTNISVKWAQCDRLKPNPENCKNCSSKCAYDCAQLQYTIQNRTVLIISPLTDPDKHHSLDVVYRRRGGCNLGYCALYHAETSLHFLFVRRRLFCMSSKRQAHVHTDIPHPCRRVAQLLRLGFER